MKAPSIIVALWHQMTSKERTYWNNLVTDSDDWADYEVFADNMLTKYFRVDGKNPSRIIAKASGFDIMLLDSYKSVFIRYHIRPAVIDCAKVERDQKGHRYFAIGQKLIYLHDCIKQITIKETVC